MQHLDLQGFSYEDRHGFLSSLVAAFTRSGGWVVDRRTISPTSMEFRLEIQFRSIVDLYAAIIGAGLELTRAGHLALTDLCTCRKHLAQAVTDTQMLTIRVEINFLEDITLHSLLAGAACNA